MKDITISEAYIKSRIDEIIKDMEDEYSSKHEVCTKVVNYEYFSGKLNELYRACDDDIEIITYRLDEITQLENDFQKNYVEILYRRSRRAEARANAFANYGAKEVWL